MTQAMAGETSGELKRPDWARPLGPPDMLAPMGIGSSVLERMKDWPRLPTSAPDDLVIRCSANYLELRVNNILPIGIFGFIFGLWFSPFVAVFGFWGVTTALSSGPDIEMWTVLILLGASLLFFALFVFLWYMVFWLDVKGGAGDNLTIFDRKSRKVYQRLPKKLAKGEWNWDVLHPYTDRRNSGTRVNEALLLVELDAEFKKAESLVNVHVVGMSKEPLFHTYSFIKEFMEHGVTNLPPFRLTDRQEPAWYTSMPPWFFWLPRQLAKSIWAFALLLFVWPVVVWARLMRLVLPYSRWPAEFEAQLRADAEVGTPAEKAWLEHNLKPPQPLPITARFAFALAVVVSAPWWWIAVSYYVRSVAKFVGV